MAAQNNLNGLNEIGQPSLVICENLHDYNRAAFWLGHFGMLCHNPLTTIITICNLLYLIIISPDHIGYEMADGQQGAMRLVGYNQLANKRKWNNCSIIIKNTPCQKLKHMLCRFVEHGIMAHNP